MSPPEWEAHSRNNISRAQSSRAQSEALRKQIQAVLAKCFQDVNAQNAAVQLAFGKRVNEMTKAKRTLEAQLRKVIIYLVHYSTGFLLGISKGAKIHDYANFFCRPNFPVVRVREGEKIFQGVASAFGECPVPPPALCSRIPAVCYVNFYNYSTI